MKAKKGKTVVEAETWVQLVEACLAVDEEAIKDMVAELPDGWENVPDK